MPVMLFIIVLVASFIIVRGAIAFQLTGLEWSQAKFQSLSCYSGTGFTTKEAELITTDKQRRRIASILMVLGNAGLVTLIASAASALNPRQAFLTTLSESFLPFKIPDYFVPIVNLSIIVIALYILYKISVNKKLTEKLTKALRKKILKRELFKPVSFEELLLATGGYGVARIDVCEKYPVANKTLAQSELRKMDVTVLVIERQDDTIPNPAAEQTILADDRLICFGKLDNIRNKICII